MHYKTATGIQKIANQLRVLRKIAEEKNDPRETGILNDGQMIGTFGDKNPESYLYGKYCHPSALGCLATNGNLSTNRLLQRFQDPLYQHLNGRYNYLIKALGDKDGWDAYNKYWRPMDIELSRFYRESGRYNLRKFLNKGKDIGPFKFDFKHILDPVEQKRLLKLQPTIARNNQASSNTAIG